VAASSPDITLSAPRLRKGARFIYEYDLNIPWRHEVRIEDWVTPVPDAAYPCCADGIGECPPEDGGGPAACMGQPASACSGTFHTTSGSARNGRRP